MQGSYLICSLAAATATVALGCGVASAQPPTNGNPAHPSPTTGGPTLSLRGLWALRAVQCTE